LSPDKISSKHIGILLSIVGRNEATRVNGVLTDVSYSYVAYRIRKELSRLSQVILITLFQYVFTPGVLRLASTELSWAKKAENDNMQKD